MITEQHMLGNTAQYKQALQNVIENRKVLELGVGTGVLTELLLDVGAKQIVGFEIQEGLCQIQDERFSLVIADYTKYCGSSFYNDETGYCLVANPAYSTLENIKTNILPFLTNAILMIPGRELTSFQELGFRELFSLEGDSFQPPATGKHHVMIRGFSPRFVDLQFEISKVKSQKISERANEISKILPPIAICGFGGIPIRMQDEKLFWSGNPVNLKFFQNAILEALGLSALLTYTNKNNKTLEELGSMCAKRKETWAYHWITLTMVFASQPPEVQLSFARDGRFRLGWTVEKNYTGQLFTASANLRDWIKFVSKKYDLSFDAPTRKAMRLCSNLLENILP